MKIRYLALPIVILVAVGGGYAYRRSGVSEGANGYVTDTVTRGMVAATVTATGTLNPVTTVQVGTYVSGPIIALDVDYNSLVRKGQRVAKIDPRSFAVKLQQAEANLTTAKARVEKSRADLLLKRRTMERNRTLFERHLISQNDLDTARSNFEQAVAQLALDESGVRQTEAACEEARINLAYTDITSPVDGVVVSRNVSVGQTVAASFQTPTLFLIAEDLTKMQVDTNVSESDIGDVARGQAVTFTVDAYPGREFRGEVAQVRNAPITVQNVVTYDVVIAVDNPELLLKPGMTATVSITTARRDDVLRVAQRALRFTPEQAAAGATPTGPPAADRKAGVVWVLEPDRALRRVEVRTGLVNEQFAEIVSGDVKVGEQVAVAVRREAKRATQGPPPFAGARPR